MKENTDKAVKPEIIEKSISRSIPIEDLHLYMEGNARTASDIMSSAGNVLLPRNTRLASLFSSRERIERLLRQEGFFSVPIVLGGSVDIQELEAVIKSLESGVTPIDPDFAKDTAEQVEDVYERIIRGTCSKTDVSGLAEQGKNLARQVSGAPQIMFCLGQVRSWDEYTGVHSLNVALLSSFLAEKMYPDQPELAELMAVGGILHDLGKARTPQEVLNKPGKLTKEEFEIMRQHPQRGLELALENGVSDPRILNVISGHHERFNGGGYPNGISGNDIPLESRISAVADVFDALTAKRVYKDPIAGREALSIMMGDMVSHFDPTVIRALLLSLGLYPPGSMVELSDGSMGLVIGVHGKDLLRPDVILQYDSLGRKAKDMTIVDLVQRKDLYIVGMIGSIEKKAF